MFVFCYSSTDQIIDDNNWLNRLQSSLANPASVDSDVQLIRTALVWKFQYIFLCVCTVYTHTQSVLSAKLFILEEGLFVLGYL